jgi:hypothetical protein
VAWHPSGNVGLARGHWVTPLVTAAALLFGAAALVWLNLAHVAASYAFPPDGGGLWGTLRMAAWPGAILRWISVLSPFQRAAIPPVRPLFANPAHEAWSRWWSYAFAHSLGASPRGADIPHVLGVNMLIFLALGALPAYLLSEAAGRLLSPHDPDTRIGTGAWTPPPDLRTFVRAAGSPGSLPLGVISRRLPGAGSRIAIPFRDPDASVSRFSHVALWGVTEAGKTSSIYKPWLWADLWMNDTGLLDRDGRPAGAMSSVAIDMKHPDLYETLAPYAAPLPRRLLLLAPGDPERSMHYNPLDFVVTPRGDPIPGDIEALVDVIVLTTPLSNTDVSYHQGNERRLLALLIQYVCEVQKALDEGVPGIQEKAQALMDLARPHIPAEVPAPRIRSLPMVAALTRSNPEALLRTMFETVTNPQAAYVWPSLVGYLFTDLTRGWKPRQDAVGWLDGLARRLSPFSSPAVALVSDRCDFSLDLVGRQPSTLILGMPSTSTQSLETYSALIITQLVLSLRKLAGSRPDRRLPVSVTVYLDELANQGRIPRLEEDMATARDLGIAFVLGIQNTSQLEARYGERTADSLLSNANTKIVLGRNLGFKDAEKFSKATGETTLIASSASRGARGSSLSEAEARRAFMTPDQIRRMRLFEALVFLQTGGYTKVMLTPFHRMRRPPGIPRDDRFVAGAPGPHGGRIPPVVFLRHKHHEMNARLGHWDTRPSPPPRPSRPQGSGEGSPPPEGAPQGEPAAALAAAAAQAAAGPAAARQERVPPAASPSLAEAAGHASRAQEMGVAEGDRNGSSHPDRHTADEWGAVSTLLGLVNSILRGRSLPQDGAGLPAGWVAKSGSGTHLVVRREAVDAFASRGGGDGQAHISRWERHGLALPGARRASVGGESHEVIVFSPAAFARLTPAAAARVASWPEIPPESVGIRGPASAGGAGGQGGGPAAPPRGAQHGPAPGSPGAAAPPAAPADAASALDAVVQWARANERALKIAQASEIGQWSAVVQGEPVLLVRQHVLSRLLIGRRIDLRAALEAWRDARVIVTPEEKRFTVYSRTGDPSQKGARYVAIRWSALEAAGLSRGAP